MKHPGEPDLVLQGIAWIANALVIVGCVRGILRLQNRSLADLGRFAVAFTVATATLAGAIATFSPGRLILFAQALHPHWP